MALMNEFLFAVVPPPSAHLSFFRLLPKVSAKLSFAEALDLSGWLMWGLKQVSGTPKRDCAATRNSSFVSCIDRTGAPSPNEFENRSLAENTKAMRRWSAGGRSPARRSRPLARRPLITPKALFWTLPMR